MATIGSVPPSGNSHTHSSDGFSAHVGNLNNSAHEFWDNARGVVTDLRQAVDLKGRVGRHPYGMIAAAIGVGYVLGGGVFTHLTGRLVRLGLRLAALPLVKQELLGMAESALDGFSQRAGAASGTVGSGPGTGGSQPS